MSEATQDISNRSIKMRWFAPLIVAISAVGCDDARAFEMRTGFDVIQDPETTISGLHGLFIGQEIAPDLAVGMSIYSGAIGDAGGAFFWGYELLKRVPLGRDVSLTFSGFVGGGGGAAQVIGNGLMTRANVGLSFGIGDRSAADLGISWIAIDGADIDGPALSFGLSYDFGKSEDPGGSAGLNLRAVSLRFSKLTFPNSLTRTGVAQSDVSLVGAEASFLIDQRTEFFLAADGAAKGAEGYMQVLAGLRERIPIGPVSFFAEGALGFGGGGNVDTGGGFLVNLGIGVAVPIAPWGDLEFALGGSVAPDGDASGVGAMVRLTRVFGRDRKVATEAQNWQFSTGLSKQFPNDTFRKPGVVTQGSPVMIESSIDLFISENFYITGNAQTTIDGNVAGYAIGLLGAGYRFPIAEDWALSVEAHIGAAGGGGVNAEGGAITGLRAEIDYKLNDSIYLSTAVGQLRTISGEGMTPSFVQVGVKFPFRTQ